MLTWFLCWVCPSISYTLKSGTVPPVRSLCLMWFACLWCLSTVSFPSSDLSAIMNSVYYLVWTMPLHCVEVSLVPQCPATLGCGRAAWFPVKCWTLPFSLTTLLHCQPRCVNTIVCWNPPPPCFLLGICFHKGCHLHPLPRMTCLTSQLSIEEFMWLSFC